MRITIFLYSNCCVPRVAQFRAEIEIKAGADITTSLFVTRGAWVLAVRLSGTGVSFMSLEARVLTVLHHRGVLLGLRHRGVLSVFNHRGLLLVLHHRGVLSLLHHRVCYECFTIGVCHWCFNIGVCYRCFTIGVCYRCFTIGCVISASP